MKWTPPPRAIMNRRLFSSWTGIPYSTLQKWERLGVLVPLVIEDRPYFTAEHLAALERTGLAGAVRFAG